MLLPFHDAHHGGKFLLPKSSQGGDFDMHFDCESYKIDKAYKLN